jgi:hypothetical protein
MYRIALRSHKERLLPVAHCHDIIAAEEIRSMPITPLLLSVLFMSINQNHRYINSG